YALTGRQMTRHAIRLAVGGWLGMKIAAHFTAQSLLWLTVNPASRNSHAGSLAPLIVLAVLVAGFEIRTVGQYLFGKISGARIYLRAEWDIPPMFRVVLRKLTLGQRLMVVLGGPVANLVVGTVAFFVARHVFGSFDSPLSWASAANEMALW